jgi:hypothetical protein
MNPELKGYPFIKKASSLQCILRYASMSHPGLRLAFMRLRPLNAKTLFSQTTRRRAFFVTAHVAAPAVVIRGE